MADQVPHFTIDDFRAISQGTFNIGHIDIEGQGNQATLKKVNHHVNLQYKNVVALDPQKSLQVKEAFIGALREANVNGATIARIEREIGMADVNAWGDISENKTLLERRVKPLTRQQVKAFLYEIDHHGQKLPRNANLERIQRDALRNMPRQPIRHAQMFISALSGFDFGKAFKYISRNKMRDAPPEQVMQSFRFMMKMMTKLITNSAGLSQPGGTMNFNYQSANHDGGTVSLKFSTVADPQSQQQFMNCKANIGGLTFDVNYGVSVAAFTETIIDNLVALKDLEFVENPDGSQAIDANGQAMGKTMLKDAIASLWAKASAPDNPQAEPLKDVVRRVCAGVLKREFGEDYEHYEDRLKEYADVGRLVQKTEAYLNNSYLYDEEALVQELGLNQLPEAGPQLRGVQVVPENVEPEAADEEPQVVPYVFAEVPALDPATAVKNLGAMLVKNDAEALNVPVAGNLLSELAEHPEVVLGVLGGKYALGDLADPPLKAADIRELLTMLTTAWAGQGHEFDFNALRTEEVADFGAFLRNPPAAVSNNFGRSLQNMVTANQLLTRDGAQDLFLTSDLGRFLVGELNHIDPEGRLSGNDFTAEHLAALRSGIALHKAPDLKGLDQVLAGLSLPMLQSIAAGRAYFPAGGAEVPQPDMFEPDPELMEFMQAARQEGAGQVSYFFTGAAPAEVGRFIKNLHQLARHFNPDPQAIPLKLKELEAAQQMLPAAADLLLNVLNGGVQVEMWDDGGTLRQPIYTAAQLQSIAEMFMEGYEETGRSLNLNQLTNADRDAFAQYLSEVGMQDLRGPLSLARTFAYDNVFHSVEASFDLPVDNVPQNSVLVVDPHVARQIQAEVRAYNAQLSDDERDLLGVPENGALPEATALAGFKAFLAGRLGGITDPKIREAAETLSAHMASRGLGEIMTAGDDPVVVTLAAPRSPDESPDDSAVEVSRLRLDMPELPRLEASATAAQVNSLARDLLFLIKGTRFAEARQLIREHQPEFLTFLAGTHRDALDPDLRTDLETFRGRCNGILAALTGIGQLARTEGNIDFARFGRMEILKLTRCLAGERFFGQLKGLARDLDLTDSWNRIFSLVPENGAMPVLTARQQNYVHGRIDAYNAQVAEHNARVASGQEQGELQPLLTVRNARNLFASFKEFLGQNPGTPEDFDLEIFRARADGNWLAAQLTAPVALEGHDTLTLGDEVQGPESGHVAPIAADAGAPEVNNFLKKLVRTARLQDVAQLKNLIRSEPNLFFTYLSGKVRLEGSPLLGHASYEQVFADLRQNLLKQLADRSGLPVFTAPQPDFTRLTPRERDRALAAINDVFTRDLMRAISEVPLSLEEAFAQERTGVEVQERTDNKVVPSHPLENETNVPRTARYGDDPAVRTLKPVIGAAEVSPYLPAKIAAAQDSIREVLGVLLAVSKTGDREEQRQQLYKLLQTNLEPLLAAAVNPELLASSLAPEMKNMLGPIGRIAREVVQQVVAKMPGNLINPDNLSNHDLSRLKAFLQKNPPATGVMKTALNDALDGIDRNLPALMPEARTHFQNFIRSVFNIGPDYQVNLSYVTQSPEQLKRELEKKGVDDIIHDAAFTKEAPGELAFALTVLKDYFTNLTTDEMARILSAAVAVKPADPSKGEAVIEGDKRLLTAIFKGAGPLFQKMVQGLDKRIAKQSFGEVFDNFKSSLEPVPKDMVQRQLDEYVRAYNAQNRLPPIESLKVTAPIGSATVASAYKCVVRFRSTRAEPAREEQIVLKVMRPGVKDRVAAEKKIFDQAARQVPGMEVAWKAQYDSILAEFDFRVEKANISRARPLYQVQDNPSRERLSDQELSPHLNSMEEFTEFALPDNMLALKLAPGLSFDKSMSGSINAQRDVFKGIFLTDPQTGAWVTDGRGLPVVKPGLSPEDLISKRNMAQHLMKAILIKNDLLEEVACRWIKEALFGTGTFHNDLHGGNIMMEYGNDRANSKLTLIDFGNLMTLSDKDRLAVKDLILAVFKRNGKDFTSGLIKLMPRELQPTKAQIEQIRAVVDTIMAKGDPVRDTGYRFTSIVAKLRSIGISMPPQINGLIQGLGRLQSNFEDTALDIGRNAILYSALMGVRNLEPGAPVEEFLTGTRFGSMVAPLLKGFDKQAFYKARDQFASELKDENSPLRQEMRRQLVDDVGREPILSRFSDLFNEYVSRNLNSGAYDDTIAKFSKDTTPSMAKILGFRSKGGNPAVLLDPSRSSDPEVKPYQEALRKLEEGCVSLISRRLTLLSVHVSKTIPQHFMADDEPGAKGEDVNRISDYIHHLEDVIGSVVNNVGTAGFNQGRSGFGKFTNLIGMAAVKVGKAGPGGHKVQEVKL